jgi:ATP-dependent DNA ligase
MDLAETDSPANRVPMLPMLPSAVEAPVPIKLVPQLAMLVKRSRPDVDAWLFETGLEGNRILARVESGTACLVTRNALTPPAGLAQPGHVGGESRPYDAVH